MGPNTIPRLWAVIRFLSECAITLRAKPREGERVHNYPLQNRTRTIRFEQVRGHSGILPHAGLLENGRNREQRWGSGGAFRTQSGGTSGVQVPGSWLQGQPPVSSAYNVGGAHSKVPQYSSDKEATPALQETKAREGRVSPCFFTAPSSYLLPIPFTWLS